MNFSGGDGKPAGKEKETVRKEWKSDGDSWLDFTYMRTDMNSIYMRTDINLDPFPFLPL